MKDSAENKACKLKRVFRWVGKHPGYFVLGTLMVAFLSLQPSTQPQNNVQEPPADDVPLFV